MKVSLRGPCYSRVRGEREARDSARDSRPILIAGLSLFYDTPAARVHWARYSTRASHQLPTTWLGPRASGPRNPPARAPGFALRLARVGVTHCYLGCRGRIFHAG